ncbi:ABC-2 type transport system permease protein [Asanoa ferruginea]|uniref:Transport permease protein n=1 Tax=Asanoa ferruginea TaxID=53367 RepID=A0A3D9ZX25_9ACTN|nr:ABC transporter permease [Asanoa ferruginea]REG01749.1 ABC-2 type transport system permease protein [Asanoa ferruginea]GIF49218.1 transport permease protein [Asanoa ferruginea]
MSTLALGAARAGVELRQFWRERDAVVFTFALPAVLLTLLGSLFSGVYDGSTVTPAQYLVPSMIAAGVASTTFVNLGIGIATDRDDGTLKRLRGLPMPPLAYLIGKILLVVAVTLAEVLVLVAIGVGLFSVDLPRDPARWLTFGWVFLLGTVACALLGVVASTLARSSRSAAAVLNLPYVVLCFVSGIYFSPVGALPHWVIQGGSLFPLKWMAQGFRSAFLPDTILPYEVVPSWEHGRTALVLAAWCIGGLVLCLTTFRWRGRQTR